MVFSDVIKKELIGNKVVYSFEKHHWAMIPWYELRQAYGCPLRLLTLDYHTDTRPAFISFASRQASELGTLNSNSWRYIAEQAVANICMDNKASIEHAVTLLRYDEHIDAAVKSDLLCLAFVIASHSDQGHIISVEQRILDEKTIEQLTVSVNGKVIVLPGPRPKARPPYTYLIPNNKIVILENQPVPDGEDRDYKDAVIESLFLKERLQMIDDICMTSVIQSLFEEPFILDIDLDYFNTQKSIAPNDASVFHELIRRSTAITIARESDCVHSCQIGGEGLNSKDLEMALKKHIQTAMQENVAALE